MNLQKVLLTGIKYTMQSSFYQDGFKKNGIEVIVSSEEHQNEINSIIFNAQFTPP
ncbi:aspartate/glutamate racemase family protein [Clostridium estertheticum]|uniref:aspartate/glutamate racemase family protein n=1 Tax=Clostridium estertheticum TaxID=238834 RepID=UPI001C0D6374|nr:aspartate/glutamate racemase family protein [Clostridium estertheticum]MBU3217264.1 aspartate/glutamate racemase family protein [Clostridium estertheticum]WAG55768.1 aspartate/glutamate racemase family protein [Clostridium estertheticum]